MATRIAILSDIHGNLPALEAVLADVQSFQPETIISLGDMTNGAPFPAETMALLREVNALMLRGNHEDYLIDYASGAWPAEKTKALQWSAIQWTVGQLSAVDFEETAGLPLQRVVELPGLPAIRVMHGSVNSNNIGLVPSLAAGVHDRFIETGMLPNGQMTPRAAYLRDELPAISEGLLVCGHTHLAWLDRLDGKVALNPGSVGFPLSGNPHAQYALLHAEGGQWQIQFRNVDYDLDWLRRAYRESGLLERSPGMARACLLASETGQNVALFFVQHAYDVAHQLGAPTNPAIPDDVWLEACDSFPWDKYESQEMRHGRD